MTNIIVLEGIPTAGKSQTIENLTKLLTKAGKSFVVADDHEIANLIFARNDITNRDSVDGVQEYILDIITKKVDNVDYLIMHNAHIFYAALNAHRCKFEKLDVDYAKLERFFLKHNTLIVFLRIPFDKIVSHYLFSIKKRAELNPNSRTDKFWKMKGKDNQERAQYYEDKQLTYERLLSETKIRTVSFLVTGGIELYPKLAKQILSNYFDFP